MTTVPQRYVPTMLTKKDKRKQRKELTRSRKAYKKGKYYTRKKVSSFKPKTSQHIVKARKMFRVDTIKPSRELAKATKCKLKGLKRMFQKGQGAYFSSGSRPNQTGHSWGYARLASAITGGKASAVDFKILNENCSVDSKSLKLAKKALKKYNRGMRRVKQVHLGGKTLKNKKHMAKGHSKRKTMKGGYRMKEKIIEFRRGKFPKKYTAYVRNNKTKKTRVIHFGDQRYQQYKDRVNLGLYTHKNHNTRKRMNRYFLRHSGIKNRLEAIEKEKRKSKGFYNAKILSHEYLW